MSFRGFRWRDANRPGDRLHRLKGRRSQKKFAGSERPPGNGLQFFGNGSGSLIPRPQRSSDASTAIRTPYRGIDLTWLRQWLSVTAGLPGSNCMACERACQSTEPANGTVGDRAFDCCFAVSFAGLEQTRTFRRELEHFQHPATCQE